MTDDKALEYQPPQPPVASMILLHGLGASGDDLFPLSDTIAGGRLRIVCPNAPVRPVTINGGLRMRAWYDIADVTLTARQDATGIDASAALIEQYIAAEKTRGFAADRIFLAGFSQGAAMALHVGLRHSPALAGIVALSGYLLKPDELATLPAAAAGTPIFQAHGAYDPVVLPAWARDSRDMLQAADYHLDYREYPIAHAISPEELADINDWLAERLCDL